MFSKPSYFFEPLIRDELELIAHSEKEKEIIRQVVLYHLLFAILSQTPASLRPAVLKIVKENLYQPQVVTQLSQVVPQINSELIERSLRFILTQVQSRLENTAN